ncbi:MAG: hypothetical protein U0166_01780 [Acidobacteriota bacterium]
MNCTICKGELEPGFIPDFGTAATWVAIWIAGAPEGKKGVWERVRTGASGVSVDQVDCKTIDAQRCKACGHLELFATRAPAPGTTLARS